MRSPYGRLFYRPWLRQQEREAGVAPGTFSRVISEAGNRLWFSGRWAESFDWAAICRREIGLALPDPGRPHLQEVAPLVVDGAIELMADLLHQGHRLALITNGLWRFQAPYVAALGWEALFTAVVTPDRRGTAKPDPRMFWAVPGLSWFVGDRPCHDVLGAYRAGVRTVLLGDGPLEEHRPDPLGVVVPPDMTVPSLRHLTAEGGHGAWNGVEQEFRADTGAFRGHSSHRLPSTVHRNP